MSRTESYHRMLAAASHFQQNVSLILEAKAVEAARSSQWIVHHLDGSHFDNDESQLRRTLEVHEQLIEVIDGLTKMEQAMAKHMSLLLGEQEDSDSKGGFGDLGDMFSFGGDLK